MRCVVFCGNKSMMEPVCYFSETPPFPQGIFPSHQNILWEHLDYAKMTLIYLKVLYWKPFLPFLGNTLLVFHQNHQIYYRQQVVYSIFLECGSSFTSISQPAQKRFKNVASTLVFTFCERFWNVIFGKCI